MSGGKSVPALRGMGDCDVFTLWATDQHMVYFTEARSVVIVMLCYSPTHSRLSKITNVGKAHQPPPNNLILSFSYEHGRKEDREVKIPELPECIMYSILVELGSVHAEWAVVVPREENDWVLLPHNETLTADKTGDRPEKLGSLLSHTLALLFSLSL